jgi:hypothetical protein
MTNRSSSVTGAINHSSDSVVAAINNVAESIQSLVGDIYSPELSVGPYEEVLIFNVDGRVKLHVSLHRLWYFHITGALTNVHGKQERDSFFETVFPFDPREAPDIILRWPERQGGPFDIPPVDGAHTDKLGFSKTNFVFSDGSSIATVGPSIPKLALTRNGSSQLWVASVGVITDGTGKYAGARGLGAFNGSSFYDVSPGFEDPPSGLQQLIDGFQVKVTINLKVILQKYEAT